MPGTSNILPFGENATNILTAGEYSGDAERLTGHTGGSIARSQLQNRVLKQAALMAAALAKWVVDSQPGSINDDADDYEAVAALIGAAASGGVPDATTTVKGKVELATNGETQTGTDAERAVTPAALSARTANTTRTGLVELATNAETQAGSDSTRAVTPAGLAATTATTTRRGVVELATDAEALAGVDTERAVTPASLAGAFDADLASPGWIKLPGGFIMQWGTILSNSPTTGTFPIPFPTACLGMQINGTSRVDCGIESFTTTGFTGNAGGGGETLWWFAYGH